MTNWANSRTERSAFQTEEEYNPTPAPGSHHPPNSVPFRRRPAPSLVQVTGITRYDDESQLQDPLIWNTSRLGGPYSKTSNKAYVKSWGRRLKKHGDHALAYSSPSLVSNTIIFRDSPYPRPDGTERSTRKAIQTGGCILRSKPPEVPKKIPPLPRTSKEQSASIRFHRQLGRDKTRVAHFVKELLESETIAAEETRQSHRSSGPGHRNESRGSKHSEGPAASQGENNIEGQKTSEGVKQSNTMTKMAFRTLMERHQREDLEQKRRRRYGGGGSIDGSDDVGDCGGEGTVEDYGCWGDLSGGDGKKERGLLFSTDGRRGEERPAGAPPWYSAF